MVLDVCLQWFEEFASPHMLASRSVIVVSVRTRFLYLLILEITSEPACGLRLYTVCTIVILCDTSGT